MTNTLSDRLIFEAFVWSLHLHCHNDKRTMRLLRDDDFIAIRHLRSQLARDWRNVKYTPGIEYKTWRDSKLDQLRKDLGWSHETRNLYASMLPILGNWLYYGRKQKDEATLKRLMYGGELFFSHYQNYQPHLL